MKGSRYCRAFCHLLALLISFESVFGRFLYFHHYLRFDPAYQVCTDFNMRLVRSGSETKHQALKDFTKGVENFTFWSVFFFISLKYDVATSTYRWPDGTVNALNNKWLSGHPLNPDTDQCVLQYTGQSPFHGQWISRKCQDAIPFICESEQAEDPDLALTLKFVMTYRSFMKVNSTLLNTYNQTPAADLTYFRNKKSDNAIYKGYKESEMIVCVVDCKMDDVCTGVVYTSMGRNPQSNKCIFLRR